MRHLWTLGSLLALCCSLAWASDGHDEHPLFEMWDEHDGVWDGGAGNSFGPEGNLLFYGGDLDGRAALNDERNNYYGTSAIYENFIVPDGGWRVSAVFVNSLYNYTSSGADFEIRSGVSAGNSGIVVASGIGQSSTETPTGRSFQGWTEKTLRVGALDILLSPGEYWMMVRSITFGCGGGWYLGRGGTTSAANGVGQAQADGNSFFNYYSYNFVPTSTVLGTGTWDFSYGIEGTAIPEPSTLIVLSAALFLVQRRRRA